MAEVEASQSGDPRFGSFRVAGLLVLAIAAGACGSASSGVGDGGAGGGGGGGGMSGTLPDGGTAPSPHASCYPFDQPAVSVQRAATKKVFGFYYPIFPISIENGDPSSDFWNSWLTPEARNEEYLHIGGLMRDRPLPRAPLQDPDWRQRDFETEVRRAIAAGLDGFIYEHPYRVSMDERNNQLTTMLAAALAVDPEFTIMLSPDFPTEADGTTEGVIETIAGVADHPSLHRLEDGSIVLATFAPQRKPIAYWEEVRDELAEMDIKVAFWPLLNPVPATLTAHEDWTDLVDAFASWGDRTVAYANQSRDWSEEAHRRGRGWMAPVAFEDVRHKEPDGRRYWEARNSEALRAQFEAAIESDADSVALLTLTDYAESWMTASQQRGFAVMDVIAYYTTWFKMGAPPPIVRDALYYFHRNQHTDAEFDATLQTADAMALVGGGPASNLVELLAFLTSEGELVIIQGDTEESLVAPPGMTSFRVDLVPGTTPAFELRRDGVTVERIDSHEPIRSDVVFQDMMYHAGGGLECERP